MVCGRRVCTAARPSGHDAAVRRRPSQSASGGDPGNLVEGDHFELVGVGAVIVDVRPGDAERLDQTLVDGREGRAQVDARGDRRPGLQQQAKLLVLGVEAIDRAGAGHGDSGLARQAAGKRLVGRREAARMASLDGAQKADHLVADDDRRIHDCALSAGDHLGAFFDRQLEVVVAGHGDAALGGGPRPHPELAQTVDRLGGGPGVVGRLVAGHHLGRPRPFPADEHVAVLNLEALGEASVDVDERVCGCTPDGGALTAAVGVGQNLGGRSEPVKGRHVGRRPGDDRVDTLGQHQLGRRVSPLPVTGEQLDHADALAAHNQRQRQSAPLDLGGRTGHPRRAAGAGIRGGQQWLLVGDHAGRGGIAGEGARAAYSRTNAAHIVAGHRLEGLVAMIDEREDGGRATHGTQQAGADQRQRLVGAELVDRPRGGVDQRQERLGAQLLCLGIDEEPLGGMLVAWSTGHRKSPHTLRARGVDRRAGRPTTRSPSPLSAHSVSAQILDKRAAKHENRG